MSFCCVRTTAALAAPGAPSVLMLMLSLHVHRLTQEKIEAQGVTHVDSCMLQYAVGTKSSGAGGDAGAFGSALLMLTYTACYSTPVGTNPSGVGASGSGVGLLERVESNTCCNKGLV